MIFPEKSSQWHTSPLPHVKIAGSIGSRGGNNWANRQNAIQRLTNCNFWRMMPPYRQGSRFFRYSKKKRQGCRYGESHSAPGRFFFIYRKGEISMVTDIFSSMVFDDATMEARLPKDTYKALQKTIKLASTWTPMWQRWSPTP